MDRGRKKRRVYLRMDRSDAIVESPSWGALEAEHGIIIDGGGLLDGVDRGPEPRHLMAAEGVKRNGGSRAPAVSVSA
jgi:hypothetical protein